MEGLDAEDLPIQRSNDAVNIVQDERITRAVARTFSPDFSYHMDFPCPLLWARPGFEAISLAELLELGEVRFEIWHQVPAVSSESGLITFSCFFHSLS